MAETSGGAPAPLAGQGMLPNFLIVGAAKSGTTSLARWLADHPEVYIVPEKELHFFDRSWQNGLDWYKSRFAAAGGARAVGEASPSYLGDFEAHARMAATVPDAKLIALLRNPVDRAYSHYWHWHTSKGETRTFAECVADELGATPAERRRFRRRHVPVRSAYLADGRYLPQLEHLCEHVPRKQLLVLLLEDLRERPLEIFHEVCDFLGIDRTIAPESVGAVFNDHRTYVVKTYHPAWLWSAMVRLKIGRILPPGIGAAIWRAMVRFDEPYRPLEPGLRAELVEYFREDNAALAQWLGRDLSVWQGGRETAAGLAAR